jgi:hypothetical protein
LAEALLADPQLAGQLDDPAAAGRDDVQDASLRRVQIRQRGWPDGVGAQPAAGPVEQMCHVDRLPDFLVDARHDAP